MINERDELADVYTGHPVSLGPNPKKLMRGHAQEIADAIIAAGYRKIFDGDCGLSSVKDPDDREAAEAWMRWANIVSGNGHNGIAAMRQMLTELGYRKPGNF